MKNKINPKKLALLRSVFDTLKKSQRTLRVFDIYSVAIAKRSHLFPSRTQ